MTAARPGRNLLLRDGTAADAPVIAAMRQTTLSVIAAPVDVTDRDSAGGWRELLPGAGPARVRIEAEGRLEGAVQGSTLMARAIGRTADAYRVEYDNGDYLHGLFQIARLEAQGGAEGEQSYSLVLESAAALTHGTAG
ncbi:MAG: phage tail tube protein [Alphaproteobacteria bacterium]